MQLRSLSNDRIKVLPQVLLPSKSSTWFSMKKKNTRSEPYVVLVLGDVFAVKQNNIRFRQAMSLTNRPRTVTNDFF